MSEGTDGPRRGPRQSRRTGREDRPSRSAGRDGASLGRIARAFGADERAVSTAVGYVLALAITSLLISGLLLAGGTFIEQKREQVASDELTVLGGRVAGGVVDTDRLAGASDSDALVFVRVSLPDETTGVTYAITVTNETDPAARPEQPFRYNIVLRASSINVRERVPVRTHHEMITDSTIGGDIVVAYIDADSDGKREIVIRKALSIPGPAEPVMLAQHEAVYVSDATGNLSTVTANGTVTTYAADDVGIIGPKAVDFDGDGIREIPYVTTDSKLKLIDANNQTATLTSGDGFAKDNARLAVGRWHESDLSVFYANDGQNRVYRIAPGEKSQLVVEDTNSGISSPVGPADIDSDNATEFVYLGDSQQLRYLDDGGELVKIPNGGAGQSAGPGIGDPANFDGTGTERIPFVDGSNNLQLIDASGNPVQLASNVVKAPIASVDVDHDGALEIVFIETGTNGQVHYVDDVGGNNTVKQLKTDNGSEVDAVEGPGVS